jgi:hypothetical protein
MFMENAPEASGASSARSPSGLRRLSLAMLATERTGESFTGLPDKRGGRPGGVKTHGKKRERGQRF